MRKPSFGRWSQLLAVVSVVATALAACGDDDGGATDAATADASADGSTTDAAALIDAAPPDAPVPDAAPEPNGLYAHLGGTLYSVDVTTGALTAIGPTGQEWIVITWDAAAQVARVVVQPYSPIGGAATPKLGTIDLCTGAITEGPAITLGGVQVRRAEGLARDPSTGTFYLTYGTVGTNASSQYLSQLNGTIDVETGFVTALGSHDTLQDDGDLLFFVGDELNLLDVATASSAGAIYTMNKTTGVATLAVNTGAKVLRVAPDTTRDVAFAAFGETNATGRVIGTLDLETGAFTPLGDPLAADVAPGVQFNSLFSAPTPVCL